MSESPRRISFDRAVDYYDRTRALPAEATEAVVRLLTDELRGRGTCLEIGVGTGRIALPLADAGQRMAGIDLSSAMLARLVAKAGGTAPFPIAVADATALPFEAAVFGGALCVHVLQLIPDWTDAVDELMRVVAPGGVVLVDTGGVGSDEFRAVTDRFGRALGRSETERPGLTRERKGELDVHLAGRGCVRRDLPPVIAERDETIGNRIERLEQGLYSWTWDFEPQELRRAGVATRAWAAGEFGALDAPHTIRTAVSYVAYDVP